MMRARLGLSADSKVTTRPDGTFAFQGPLTDEAAEEAHRMDQAADAGPSAIQCSGADSALKCTQVPDTRVIAGLKAGDRIYGRTVYSDVSLAIDDGLPFLEASELLCSDTAGETLACHTAGSDTPRLPASQTILVTYRAYPTLGADGAMRHIRNPTVELHSQ
jgi:hypothetical protein